MTSSTVVAPIVGTACSHCRHALVSERQAIPWCAACGWNIDCYEPDRRRPELRWKWADKISFRVAYDLNELQFAALSGKPVDNPGLSAVKVVLLAVSLVALAFEAALACFGLWLIIHVGGGLPDVLGAIVLLMAFALRPRLGKLGKYAEPVDPADLPALNRLITTVAAEIGAPVPRVLLFYPGFNASSGTYGLRRRRYLQIGLTLWLSLTPQEQVSVIAHELGHFVNGDVRRGPVTRYAFQLLGNLAALTKPDTGRARAARRGGGIAVIAEFALRPILALVSLTFSLMQLGIEWLGVRVSHHAEYSADAMSARVAGAAAAAGSMDALMLREACVTVLRRSLRADATPEAWRRAAAEGREALASRIPRLRQLSVRDSASLSISHPPVGLRARMVESRGQQTASVVLTPFESAQIDKDLAAHYRLLRTEITTMS